MLVNMKGQIIGYASIIAILIVGVLSVYYFTLSTPVSKEVTTTEGLLVSSEDFNFFLLKMLNQSIEFIAQRAAYDLALNGGFIEGREVFWNYNYPQISDLENNLANSIESNLPSSFKKFDKIVELDNANIIIEDEEQPLSTSKYFDVGGYTNISIYDETARSKTFSNFNINSHAVSSYFRLLWVAREILTNTTFNSSLNDANALLGNLTAETLPPGGRFQNLGFTVTASGNILDVTIIDLCYPTNIYCLAPLNPNEPETKRDINTPQPIPYENLKLRFRIKAVQTNPTPGLCKFSISLNPVMGSAAAGDWVAPPVTLSVINSGTTSDAVTLSAKVYNKTTMTEDHTITVTFDDNGKPMPYSTFMRIKTDSHTLGGGYLINVTGDGCPQNQEIFATYDLTVNPAMTFSISVDTDPVTLIYNGGSQSNSNSTNVLVKKLIGVSEDVLLSVTGLPAGVSYSLSQNNIPPNFPSVFSVLTLTTDGTTLPGDYTITISGIGGGSYNETQFTLHVKPSFDFELYFQGGSTGNVFRTKSITPVLNASLKSGTPEDVVLSYYDIVNSTGDTDPSNYHITVSFSQNCPLTINPLCYPKMTITTASNTPADTYTIHVNASATYVSKQVSFDITVKWGCGDGIILFPEQCEGANLNGQDCVSQGYRGGTLACIPPGQLNECTFNTSGCIYCGNNKREIAPPPAEECDGTDATLCPGNCKTDCNCSTIFNWNCSNWVSGAYPDNSANFVSPDCAAGWYPVSCLTDDFYPSQSNDAGKYGEDVIQAIKIEGNHCLVTSFDTIVPNNEQGREVCALCTNKQPTIRWGVYSVNPNGEAGGGIDPNGWFQLPSGAPRGFAYEIIDSRQCPSGMFPISCLVDVNNSQNGFGNSLVDLYLDNNNRCNATFRNNPSLDFFGNPNGEKAFTINVGIVCTNKSYATKWGGWQSNNNQIAFFGSPACGVNISASAFTESNRTRPAYYLEDALQSLENTTGMPNPFGFTVMARDTQGAYEHNRRLGIICVPPSA